MMYTKRKIVPGQPGAKKWMKKYGDDLVCIRYKYDPYTHRKMMSVELAVEEQERHKNHKHIQENKLKAVRIEYGERELGKKVRAVGGTWNRQEKVWHVRWEAVKAPGLQSRVVNFSNNRKADFSNNRNCFPILEIFF